MVANAMTDIPHANTIIAIIRLRAILIIANPISLYSAHHASHAHGVSGLHVAQLRRN